MWARARSLAVGWRAWLRSGRPPHIGRVPLRPCLIWLVAGLTLIWLFLVLPDGPPQRLVYHGLAFASAGAVVVGVTVGRLRPAASWWLLALGIALLALGDVTWDVIDALGGVTEPSLADIAYVAGTLAIFVATARLLLRRDGLMAGLLDAIIVGSAFSVLLWVLAFDQWFSQSVLSSPHFVTVIAYPALDVAMLSILLVAFLGGRPIDLGMGLFAAALIAFLVSDFTYLRASVSGAYEGGLIDAGWLLGYVLWGASALALRSPGRQVALGPAATTTWKTMRPVVRLTAVLMPLGTAAFDQLSQGQSHLLASAVTAVVVSFVVIVRLELAVREKGHLLEDRHRLEATLQQQAMEDPLTELPNRRGLGDRLVGALSEPETGAGLLILDLDDFKAVNDTLGHLTGDVLLRAVAVRLLAAVRSSDTVARFGGDEFAVVLTPCPTARTATELAQRILDALEHPVPTDRGQVRVGASIGVALSDLSGRSAEHLLRDADLALYRAKSAGKHRWAILDTETRSAALRSLSIAGELGPAIAQQQLALAFQPVMSLSDGRIESMEALVRWNHPRLGTLLPAEFLPVAERSVHMPTLGRWVLEEACATAASWRRAGLGDIGVNVNVAAAQLADERFPEIVMDALLHAGLPSELLTLEVLESSLDSTSGLARRLGRLRDAGVRLAVDDFGTGYSSLARVAELPVSELKLDRSIVGGGDRRMVGAVVRMGQTLGLRLVAEGIETEEELELVRSLGYHAAQGYLVGRPMPPARIPAFLRSWDEPRVARAREVGVSLVGA